MSPTAAVNPATPTEVCPRAVKAARIAEVKALVAAAQKIADEICAAEGTGNSSAAETGRRVSLGVERLFYTAEETRTALGISDVTLYRLTRRKLLLPSPHFRHRMFSIAAVKKFAETQ